MSSKRQKISVQQYDNGIKLYFIIKKDGLIEPLTGSTIHFKMMEATSGRTLNRTCSITDAEMAECLYILTSDDLEVTGNYQTEIQVDYANGTILSVENPVVITVTPERIGRVDVGRFR